MQEGFRLNLLIQKGKNMKRLLFFLFLIVISISACNSSAKMNGSLEETNLEQAIEPMDVREETFVVEEGSTLYERFLLPDGYERQEEQEGSFSDFLRTYPLKPYGSPVLLFDGRKKPNQRDHEAVFDMNLGDRDLQQCADSIMRVYAEYLYRTDQKDKIAFHFVDGFLCDYGSWKEGKRVAFSDKGKAYWTAKAKAGDNKEVFESYLNMVFAYSSTLSMREEARKVSLEEMQIGDVFLRAGSPGHVVMVVDMCRNAQGDTAFLLAQGFMPAQEFHILKNPVHRENLWYFTSEIDRELITPQYSFSVEELCRPPYLSFE